MNVLNIGVIERELAKAASHASHAAARTWVVTVPRNYLLGKCAITDKDILSNFCIYVPDTPGLDMPRLSDLPDWAIEAIRRGETLHWFDPFQVRRRPFWQMLDHIINWFNSWQPTDTRLPRLTRINFVTAATAANLWMTDVSEHLWNFVRDKPPIIRGYEDGYHWVRLVTNLHFERESHKMSHCIGNGHYYNMFKRGETEYYSLRDRQNEPHCTVEVAVSPKGYAVKQVKGNANSRPAVTYQRFIRRFFNDMRWKIEGDSQNIA
jgi:hypothetical protein